MNGGFSISRNIGGIGITVGFGVGAAVMGYFGGVGAVDASDGLFDLL